jgi:hypothetical protein
VSSRGTIAPGERDTYTFDAQRSERFELRLVDVNAAPFHPQIELYNPRGRAPPDQRESGRRRDHHDGGRVGARERDSPGTYTVVVSNAARSRTAAYDLYFVVGPRAIAGAELLDGVTVYGDIERGELDSFTFTTVAGQTVVGTITTLHGGTLRLAHGEVLGDRRFLGRRPNASILHEQQRGRRPDTRACRTPAARAPARAGTRSSCTALQPLPPIRRTSSGRASCRAIRCCWTTAATPASGRGSATPRNRSTSRSTARSADSPSIYALSLSTGVQVAASTPWGWFYLDGPRLLATSGRHVRSVESWFPQPTGLPLPNDPSLVGLTYTVQGLLWRFRRFTSPEQRHHADDRETEPSG